MICSILTVLVTSSFTLAATYYVDATNGNDDNDGLSQSTAWKTISKVNSSSFEPGNIVLFKRNETWHETLIVPNSGEPGKPITFGSYGEGEKPIIDGKGSLREGIMAGDNKLEGNEKDYITIEDFYIKNTILFGIDGVNTDHLTVRNCLIENIGPGIKRWDNVATGIGLIHETTNALIESNIIHDIFIWDDMKGEGIYIGACPPDNPHAEANNNTVRNNEIYNVNVGMTVKVYAVKNIIEGNYVHHADNQGIRVTGSEEEGNIVRYNFVTDCQWEGIETFNWANISYNIVKNCFAGVIIIGPTGQGTGWMDAGDDNVVYNNVFYNNVVGISLYNANGTITSDNIIKNNIISECYATILFDENITAKQHSTDYRNIFNYNSYFHSSNLMFRNGLPELDFGQWSALHGGDNYSITIDPQFISSSFQKDEDFKLQSTSPCINAGTDVGLTQDFSGNPVPQGHGFDIGAYEYNGLAPPKNLRIIYHSK